MSSGFVGVAKKLADGIGVVAVDPMCLANLLAAGSLAEVPAGHVLCSLGDPAEKIFFLVDGEVEVEKPDTQGSLRPIARVQGPAMIGHMGVIDGSTRSATCRVVGEKPATVISLRADEFLRLMTRPDATGSAVRHLVLANLIRQLGNTNITVASLLDGMSERAAATQTGAQPVQDIEESDLHLLQAVLRGWSVPPG